MSNLDTFVDNVATEIAAVDPNIGSVFKTERRWANAEEFKDDGGVIVIDTVGLFDAELDFGNAARFWILEAWAVTTPLTFATVQVRGNVRIVGFYGYKENETQAAALRDAAEAILGRLILKTTELTGLGLNMGSGYLGFLTDLPAMEGAVRTAQLQAGAQGHVVQIIASYFEEVSR